MMRSAVLLIMLVVLAASATGLVPGVPETGSLSGPVDTATHSFSVTAGRNYELFVSSDEIDVDLEVLRGSSVFIDADQDWRSHTTDAYASWSAGRSELLTARVQGNAPGNYSILLVERGVIASSFTLSASEGPLSSSFMAGVELSCAGGPCGKVIVTLDPYIDPEVTSVSDDDSVIVMRGSSWERMSKRTALESIASLRSIPEAVRARIASTDPIYRDDDPTIAVFADLPVSAMLNTSVASIGASGLWSESLGSGAICVIDSGVDYTHPALGGCARTDDINDGSCERVLGGYDFVDRDTDPFDENGHGTHVAGIVSSRDDEYRGVAPGTSIVAVRVLDARGNGNMSRVIEGIEYCTQNRESFGIRAIVMSLGTTRVYHGSCDIKPEAQAIAAAHDAGIAVFASAGNSFRELPFLGVSSPACAPHAIAIGALDDGSLASYSARDLRVVFAPGSFIKSTNHSGTFSIRSGTSMAAPHAAGSALLLSSVWEDRYARSIAPASLRLMLESARTVTDSSMRSYPSIDLEAIAARKGVVPTTSGARPFWTSSENPQSCALEDGGSCTLTWNVTGEGPSGSYVFFAYLDTDFSVTTTEERSFRLADARIAYDGMGTLLPAGEYEATVELYWDAPESITVTIDAHDPADSITREIPRSDEGTYPFSRTIHGTNDGSHVESVTASYAGTTIEVWNEYAFDSVPPSGSLPSLIPASGSFVISFDEPMDKDRFSVSFPSEAKVTVMSTWIDDRSLRIDYASSNASFDSTVELTHNLIDRVGNPALIPSLRLDAKPPMLVSFTPNATVLSADGTVRFEFVFSEPASISNLGSDALSCSVVDANAIRCTPRSGISGDQAQLSFVLIDEAGNTRSESFTTGVIVDSVPPQASLPSLIPASGSFVISFDEPMDKDHDSVSFPTEAKVTATGSWITDRNLLIEYDSSSVSFDDVVVLEHDLIDRAGNPALIPSLRLDTKPPQGSLPALIPASGSFVISFDEPMDTARSISSFPPAAGVTWNGEWESSTSFVVAYAASNASFDGVVVLEHAFVDIAGNPAPILSLRLDAVVPELLAIEANASQLGANGTVRFTITASEPLGSFAIDADHLVCTMPSTFEAECAALAGVETPDAPITLVLIDEAGNTATFEVASGVLVDSLAPRIEAIIVQSDGPIGVPLVYEDLTNITIPDLGFDSANDTSVLLSPLGPFSFVVFDELGNAGTFFVTFEEEVSGSGSTDPGSGGSSAKRSGGSSFVSEPSQPTEAVEPEPIVEASEPVEPEVPEEEPAERITLAAIRLPAQPFESSIGGITARPDVTVLLIPLLAALAMAVFVMRRPR